MGDTLIRMPKLADTLVEGTLGQWLKQVGEPVGQGEPLASIETDKVTTELTSPAAGTLLEVLVAEGQTVPIETPIARIGAQSDVHTEAQPKEEPPKEAQPKPTPVAARLLAEHGLTALEVSSRSGRVTKEDVLAFISQRSTPRAEPPAPPSPPTPTGQLIPLTPMRRAIADHMVEARQTIPQGQTVMDADLTTLVAWREQHKAAFLQEEQANLTYTVFFVYALARALAEGVDIGVAVALDGGLIVPVLRNAHSLTLGATARGIADLAARARSNKLAPDETQGARMTVTNVGSFGNLTASPIVPLGQIGILGPGLVERRPLPGPDGGIRLGWRCLVSFMFDRRAFGDLEADRFLCRVITELYCIPEAVAV